MRRLTGLIALALSCIAGAAHAQSGAPMLFPADQFGQPNKSFSQSSGYTPSQVEALMGKTDVFEPIYDLSDQDPYRRAGLSIGMLDLLVQTANGAFGNATCTATVLSNQYILTNYHCAPGKDFKTIKAQLRMGFLDRSRAVGTLFNVTLPPVEADSALDYAILKVEGNPATTFGALRFRTSAAYPRESLVLVHYPAGQPQKLTRYRCVSGDPLMQGASLIHRCDTLPGSSGALVLAANDLSVVGLHFAGVPDPVNPFNEARPIASLLAKSPILRALAAQNNAPAQQASVQRPAAPAPAAPVQREAAVTITTAPAPQLPPETLQFCQSMERLHRFFVAGSVPGGAQLGNSYPPNTFIGTNILNRASQRGYAFGEMKAGEFFGSIIFDGSSRAEVQTWLNGCFQYFRAEYDRSNRAAGFVTHSNGGGSFISGQVETEFSVGRPERDSGYVAAESRYVSGGSVTVFKTKP